MNRDEIILSFLKSDMFRKWHWFSYHFAFYCRGLEHPFAKSIVDALVNIDQAVPGFAFAMSGKISSVSGREKHQPHYEQLIQICAELYVMNRVISFFEGQKFDVTHEPTTKGSAKNPEFIIRYNDTIFGVEVKAPSLINHMNIRYNNPAQVSTRVPGFLDKIKESYGGSNVTLPRDNPMKDFLLSANEKFKGFKLENPEFISLLVVIWDDFIYEPISALVGEPAGLFLPASFAKDENGEPLSFDNLDAVILDRHLINIIKATRDEPLHDKKLHAMDYGKMDEFPYKVIIPSPCSRIEVPEVINRCFQVYPPSPELGAEYMASDFIMWQH